MHYQKFPKHFPCRACLSFLLIFVFFLLPAIPALSQERTPVTTEQDEVIKVNANLVNLDVIVKDKKGKPITDLKAEDFTVSENGTPQKIEFFDSTLTTTGETVKPGDTASVQTVTRVPGAFPRNIIALVLDGQSTELANLKHVREGMVKYIRERITDTDSVALFSISGGLKLLQSFTQDKARLIAAVENAYDSSIVSKTSESRDIAANIDSLRDKIAAGPSGSIPSSPAAGAMGSAMAQKMIAERMLEQYIQFRSALSAQQTRPVLAALAAIAEGLRSVPGKKTLVMFSQGFVAPEALDWQVQSTIDIANRANVAMYIIDATGLTGGTPTSGALGGNSPLAAISGDTDMEHRRRAGAGESVFDIARQEGLNRQHDLLYRISEDTGGHFLKNTNDIAGGLERIDAEIRSRYTLAYRSTDPNFDGSFRKVKIEVRRPDAVVFTRSGYYAIPPAQVIPFSPEDRKLLANFADLKANSNLPLSLQLTSFRNREGFYVVPVSFEIPPASVQFERKADKQRLQLEVLGVVRAEGAEKILSRLGGYFDVMLTAPQYESIQQNKIFYRQDMLLQPGNYTVDLIVKDRLSGKVAAKQEKLVLPAEDSEFSTSEAILSRHAEPLKQPGTNDVLSEGGVQIRPSPSREFRQADNLIVFFRLYNAALSRDTGKTLVRVTLTVLKDGKIAMRPVDYQLIETVNETTPPLAFAKYIKLAGLAPGNYVALIQSRDIVQNKALKQEVPFTVVP
jgi:VWFA-related protein